MGALKATRLACRPLQLPPRLTWHREDLAAEGHGAEENSEDSRGRLHGAASWSVGLRSVEPRGDLVLAAASVLLQWETISLAVYKGSPGRWGSGIWGWGGKILSIAVLSRSVAQLGVPDNHRASGYPRIASLSHKCQPVTHDLLWFHVRKWFPLWASGEGYMTTQGYSCLVPASNEFSIPELPTEPKVLWFFSCSNHTDRWLGAMLPWKGAQASFGWKELN